MKRQHLLIALATVASFTTSFAAAQTPIQEARQHLERAHTLLVKKEEGDVGKKAMPKYGNIVAALSAAEVSLNEVKKNKGSNTNVALKFTAEAKAEVDLAKDGGSDHLDKAQTAIEQALKRVMQSIEINQRRH